VVTLNLNDEDLIHQDCEEKRYLEAASDAFPLFIHFKVDDDKGGQREVVVMVT
jgi:hypothetical protein